MENSVRVGDLNPIKHLSRHEASGNHRGEHGLKMPYGQPQTQFNAFSILDGQDLNHSSLAPYVRAKGGRSQDTRANKAFMGANNQQQSKRNSSCLQEGPRHFLR